MVNCFTGSVTPFACDVTITSCLQHTSCTDCKNKCLWCDSTHKCVEDDLYPVSFLYGQCLGWSLASHCPGKKKDLPLILIIIIIMLLCYL